MGASTSSAAFRSKPLFALVLCLPMACGSPLGGDARALNGAVGLGEPVPSTAPSLGAAAATRAQDVPDAQPKADDPLESPGKQADAGELVWQPLPLAPDWQTSSPHSFADWLEAHFPSDRFSEPTREQLELLAGVLERADFSALRAALILARSQSPLAAEVLLERLEARVPAPDRAGDAADAVAAASFASWHPSAHGIERLPQRLANLSQGASPHPDLEVRVECARSAVLLGQDSPLPFLLDVLRIGTATGKRAGTFWPAPETTAWARGRAAEVLSWRAGTPCNYPVDGSLAAREAEALKLEKLLH